MKPLQATQGPDDRTEGGKDRSPVVNCKDCCDDKVCRACGVTGFVTESDGEEWGIFECGECSGTGVCPWCDEGKK